MQKPTLVAVDTNVVLLLATGHDLTLDAWQTIQKRIKPVHFLVPPTVIQELVFQSHEASDSLQPIARQALRNMRSGWQLEPGVLNAVQHGIAQRAADRLCERGLLPAEERHDAQVLAEAAVLDCLLLLSHDSHLRDIDFLQLNLLFRELDLPVPVIATPLEVVKKFYQ